MRSRDKGKADAAWYWRSFGSFLANSRTLDVTTNVNTGFRCTKLVFCGYSPFRRTAMKPQSPNHPVDEEVGVEVLRFSDFESPRVKVL
jgi:hypothetical protein